MTFQIVCQFWAIQNGGRQPSWIWPKNLNLTTETDPGAQNRLENICCLCSCVEGELVLTNVHFSRWRLAAILSVINNMFTWVKIYIWFFPLFLYEKNWWNYLLYRKIRFMVSSIFFYSKWLPTAILKMTSNLKSDSRNGLSRSLSFRKYTLVWVLLPKIAYSDIMLLF